MTEEKIYCIYMYTSPSGKCYIGQTKNLKSRRRGHQKTRRGCVAFQGAIKKYGFENFIEEILEENLTLEEANVFEELYIESYNTLTPNGYNLKSGGDNITYSEESRQKMREVRIGKYIGENSPNWGRKFSEETKKKMSENHWDNSGENNHMYGKTGILHPNYGKKDSEETRQKKRNIHKGKAKSEEHCKKNGLAHSNTYVIIFPDGHEEFIINMAEFCRNHNLYANYMYKIANNIPKHKSNKGFKCRHITEEEYLTIYNINEVE